MPLFIFDRIVESVKMKQGVPVLIIPILKVHLMIISTRIDDMESKQLHLQGNLDQIGDVMKGRCLALSTVLVASVNKCMMTDLPMMTLSPEFQTILNQVEVIHSDQIHSPLIFRRILVLAVHLFSLQGMLQVKILGAELEVHFQRYFVHSIN